METVWRNCGSCKKPIGYLVEYYACEISSCRKTAYCSMACFDEHIPVFRHKDAWATKQRAPAQGATTQEGAHMTSHEEGKEILIVASKLKHYINAKSGMNTSANVMDRLSDVVRLMCDKAIENARADGRKTVKDRDFEMMG